MKGIVKEVFIKWLMGPSIRPIVFLLGDIAGTVWSMDFVLVG